MYRSLHLGYERMGFLLIILMGLIVYVPASAVGEGLADFDSSSGVTPEGGASNSASEVFIEADGTVSASSSPSDSGNIAEHVDNDGITKSTETVDGVSTEPVDSNSGGDSTQPPSALKQVKRQRESNTMRWKWGAIMVGGDPNFAVAPRKRVPKILVIGVISKASNVEKRNAIRQTWASRERTGVVIKFVLGYSQTPEAPPEDIDLPDVLRVPVVDSYMNVMRKTLHFFEWALNYHNPGYLMKCDDDTYLALDSWMEKLGVGGVQGSFSKQRVYYGHFWTGPPIRERGHKNYASYECYPLPLFTPYAHGAAFMLSFDLVRYFIDNQALLSAGMKPRCGSLEDVQFGRWLFGLGVTPRHDHRLSDVMHCHSASLALFDVTPGVMRAAHAAHVAGSPLCTVEVRSSAVAAYTHQLSRTPSNPRLHNNMGVQRLLMRDWEGAVEGFSRAVALEKAHDGPVHNLRAAEHVVNKQCDLRCQNELLRVFNDAILTGARRIGVPFYDDPDQPLYSSFSHIRSDFEE